MAHRVLHDRLQEERRHDTPERGRGGRDRDVHAIREASLLDGEILTDQVELVAEWHF